MTRGRPADPARARRGTGNRPKPGEAKPAKPIVPLTVLAVEPVEQFPPTPTVPTEVHDVWRAAVADLGGANNMRESYVPALEAYCLAVYLHAQAAANLRRYGVLVAGQRGPMPNPMLKVQKDAAATMLRYAETLGLTPAARIRLGLMEITGMSLLSTLNAGLDRA